MNIEYPLALPMIWRLFTNFINTNKIMKSRVREFNEARSNNLAKTQSSISIGANLNLSQRQTHLSNNQSFTSSFLKKTKPDVCVTCVNKKIVTEKKTRQKEQKMEEVQKMRAEIEHLKGLRDPLKEYREQLKNQAKEYNQKLISTHRQSIQSQKQLDRSYLHELSEKQQNALNEDRERMLQQKQAEQQYRKDLYLQYKQEQQRKNQQKLESKKAQVSGLKLQNIDRSKMIKEYSSELKKQISTKTIKKMTQRQKEIEEERLVLSESEKNFMRYTQFIKKETPNINPEVFEELKLIDYSKRTRKIEEREEKERARLQQLQREKQLIKSENERNLKLKNQYQQELKDQMNQKSKREAIERQKDRSYQERVYNYTEDIVKESRVIRPCECCNHKYDEKCLI